MSEDRITEAIRGYKRNSRERKELTDPDLRDSAVEKPDDLGSEKYGPRNPSVKAKPEPRYTKDQVSFEHPAKGRNDCDECVHFLSERNACEIVQGKVMAEDWCRKFTALTGGQHEEEEEEES